MCFLCQRNIKEIDWRNGKFLSRFLSASAKIKPRKKTRLCSHHQRLLKKAIKKARIMSILPHRA